MFAYKKLGKFTYNIVKNRQEINLFLKKWLGREWEIDYEEHPEQGREWQDQLPKMNFRLSIVDIKKIKPKKELMNYKKGSYSFREELNQRLKDREESMLRGVSIEPLIVRESDMEIMDGYTRYFVLKKFGEKKAYVYLGK